LSCQLQAREEADCAFDRRWWKTRLKGSQLFTIKPTVYEYDDLRAEFEALVAMAYDNDELDMLKGMYAKSVRR
jgi:hypothetical protein